MGGGTLISANLFQSGNTLAARIAAEYSGASTPKEQSSLFYLAVILLAFSLTVNLVAQMVFGRAARRQGVRT
jgi:phosphate transport system permease protein